MRELLEKIIDATAEKAAPLQLQVGTQLLAGAVKRSDRGEGLFEMCVLMGDPGSTEAVAVRVTFPGDAVQAIYEEFQRESPTIHVPRDGSIIVKPS